MWRRRRRQIKRNLQPIPKCHFFSIEKLTLVQGLTPKPFGTSECLCVAGTDPDRLNLLIGKSKPASNQAGSPTSTLVVLLYSWGTWPQWPLFNQNSFQWKKSPSRELPLVLVWAQAHPPFCSPLIIIPWNRWLIDCYHKWWSFHLIKW